MLDFIRESILGFPPFITYFGLSILMLGLYIPPYLAEWYRAAARMIGGG